MFGVYTWGLVVFGATGGIGVIIPIIVGVSAGIIWMGAGMLSDAFFDKLDSMAEEMKSGFGLTMKSTDNKKFVEKLKLLESDLRLELGMELKAATAEERRQAAICLSEFFMIIGKEMGGQPNSSVRAMYIALLALIDQDEQKFKQKFNYYLSPAFLNEMQINNFGQVNGQR